MSKILIVEDDRTLGEELQNILKREGHETALANDGAEGLKQLTEGTFDLLILDRMLPNIDGITLLKRARAKSTDCPILILSALGRVEEKLEGFKSGCDDYLVKPFATAELIARVDALIRRGLSNTSAGCLQVGDLTLDSIKRIAKREGKIIRLSAREFEILSYFINNRDILITRRMLTENIWGYHFDTGTNIIEVHVSRLRRKIDEGFAGNFLVTVRGKGYMFLSECDHG